MEENQDKDNTFDLSDVWRSPRLDRWHIRHYVDNAWLQQMSKDDDGYGGEVDFEATVAVGAVVPGIEDRSTENLRVVSAFNEWLTGYGLRLVKTDDEEVENVPGVASWSLSSDGSRCVIDEFAAELVRTGDYILIYTKPDHRGLLNVFMCDDEHLAVNYDPIEVPVLENRGLSNDGLKDWFFPTFGVKNVPDNFSRLCDNDQKLVSVTFQQGNYFAVFYTNIRGKSSSFDATLKTFNRLERLCKAGSDPSSTRRDQLKEAWKLVLGSFDVQKDTMTMVSLDGKTCQVPLHEAKSRVVATNLIEQVVGGLTAEQAKQADRAAS